MCCACSGTDGGDGSCQDTNFGAGDTGGDGCDWYESGYGCGNYDHVDFYAGLMCCGCGGGWTGDGGVIDPSGTDDTQDGQPGDNFQEWLDCYESSYDSCGDNWTQHSAYYECYWNNVGCEDRFWHDCYWYNETCEWMEGKSPEYIEGYVAGFEDGYVDAAIELTPQVRDDDMTEFMLQMVIDGFETWVQEQE